MRRPERIPPQPPEEWSPATRTQLDGVVSVGRVRKPIHLPAVIAHHPSHLGPYLTWAKAIALSGVLSARVNELLTLRTSFLCESAFEWGVHTEYARGQECLSDDEIAAIAVGPDAPGWDPVERALLRAADELHASSSVSDATWAELAGRFDAGELVEIVFVVGHYTMLSMLANSAGLPPLPDWSALPPAGRDPGPT